MSVAAPKQKLACPAWLQTGAYLTDGEKLYEVLWVDADWVEFEDASIDSDHLQPPMRFKLGAAMDQLDSGELTRVAPTGG